VSWGARGISYLTVKALAIPKKECWKGSFKREARDRGRGMHQFVYRGAMMWVYVCCATSLILCPMNPTMEPAHSCIEQGALFPFQKSLHGLHTWPCKKAPIPSRNSIIMQYESVQYSYQEGCGSCGCPNLLHFDPLRHMISRIYMHSRNTR
jgi:hypothetical protein